MHESIENMQIEIQQGSLTTRYAEWSEMAVRHAKVPTGTDLRPVLMGLPGDRCPSPHWGMVPKDSIQVRHADGTVETTTRRRRLLLAGRAHGMDRRGS